MKQLIADLRSGKVRSDNLAPVTKRDVRFAGEMFLRAAVNDVYWRGCEVEGCFKKHYAHGLCSKHLWEADRDALRQMLKGARR